MTPKAPDLLAAFEALKDSTCLLEKLVKTDLNQEGGLNAQIYQNRKIINCNDMKIVKIECDQCFKSAAWPTDRFPDDWLSLSGKSVGYFCSWDCLKIWTETQETAENTSEKPAWAKVGA